MNNFLAVLAIIAGCIGLVWSVVYMAFWILNRDPIGGMPFPPPVPDEPGKPVAWRIRRGNRYYYMDKSEPFPVEDAEPLYLGKKQ